MRLWGRQPGYRAGLTLLELLTVLAIIALVLTILLPAIGKAKQRTRKTICAGYHYKLVYANACEGARIRLAAFDCGCYGEPETDLPQFELPEGISASEFRKTLEADVFGSCQ